MNRNSLIVMISLIVVAIGSVLPGDAQGTGVFQQLRNKDLEGALETLGTYHDLGFFWERDRRDAIPAFVGGVSRLLAQEDEADQYDLLYQWTMPTESRQNIRIFTSPVPHVAPPENFARVIRERPRKTSFEVASINGIRGLYCTGWNLVNLADSLGRLDRLTIELEELNQQQIPDADVLLLLAKMVHRQPDVPFIQDNLPKIVQRISQTSPKEVAPEKVLHPSILALGAAALGHDELAPAGELILRNLRDKANFLPAYRMRGFLHASQAVAEQQTLSDSPADFLYDNQLKYWVPVANEVSGTSVEGSTPPIWLTHEEHILHLTGVYNDVLFFRYPLAGEFEFVAEVQSTAPKVSNASTGFGGLFFQSLGVTRDLTVWDADMVQILKKPCPFAREQNATSFNRVSIRSTSDEVQYAVNRHPMWTDQQEEVAASPFFGFRYYGNHRSLIRNLELTGHPVIPREVLLTSGTQLRGWRSRYFGESKRTANAEQFPEANYRWFMENGELLALRLENETSRQSWLSYQRPLLEAETIRYEFYYVPGETVVHPSLGRLAFLIEPGGVNIHWITDGAFEWTGLPEDNATFEPLNRRGSRPLPLNESDWNAVELSRKDNQLTLSLNGETIYVRPLDFAGDTNFGLFRDPSESAVRVRNIILSGDWPETVPAEFLQNPTAVIDEATQKKNRLSLHSMAGPELLSENFNVIRRHAASLPPSERYEFLARWVLPSEVHPDLRLIGEFTQTDPSPLALELEPYRFGDARGAELVSPVFDLLNTAVELGRIEELSDNVDALPESPDLEQRRAKVALQIMLALERGESEDAQKLADELQLLLHDSFNRKATEFWPEIHLVSRAMHRHAAFKVIGGLITDLFEQRLTLRKLRLYQNHILLLTREYLAALHNLPNPRDVPIAGLKDWIPVTKSTAEFRGIGSPQTRWMFNDEQVLTLGSGQNEDYLFYRSPLTGNYEVHCKMAENGTSQVLIGGRFLGTRGYGKKLTVGSYHRGGEDVEIAYPVMLHDRTVYHRAIVEQGRIKVLINGQQLTEYQPDDAVDAWVALRSLSNSNTAFHQFEISGNPTIPDEVAMTTSDDLSCWLPYQLGTKEFTWNRIEDETGRGIIQSSRCPDLAGSHFEGLLRYHRPLWEDGSVEYEFMYQPGQYHVHPALDRLVFLLAPEGVRIHWLTDEKYDFTAVPPDNAIDEPQNRRGPERLPLLPNEWNRLKISLRGSSASLELNGVRIYERELESTNQRTFGLFHYADRNEVLVRNPVMRGDWPKTLPPIGEQQLADPKVADADRNLAKLKKVFHHDFEKDGLPIRYFTVNGVNPSERQVTVPEGVQATMTDATGWQAVGLLPRFSLYGDFDIQAKVGDFDFSDSGVEGAALLDLKLDDEQQHYLRVMIGLREDIGPYMNAVISLLHPDGKRTYHGRTEADASGSGMLRIARIGKRILFMFAQGDSSAFRVIREETISDAYVLMHGIQLKTSLRDGRRSSVIWKNVTLRAEDMKYRAPIADEDMRQIAIMNADGTNVRKLTGVLPEMSSVGSPEFSRDGKQIAIDMSQGSTTTSHIIVLNSDGTELRDLGLGCMPSISPDGQKIAFSVPRSGIVWMDADGSNREVIAAGGWGVQFSPDGKFLAYGRAGQIILMNLKTKAQTELFTGPAARRYASTYWNLGWSHDSKSIAFKGRLNQGGDEIVVVDIDNPDSPLVLVPDASGINPDFTFTPDNQSVVFSKHNPKHFGAQLYVASRKTPGEYELLPGQPESHKVLGCDWSHDGRFIVLASIVEPEPVDWEPRQSDSEFSRPSP